MQFIDLLIVSVISVWLIAAVWYIMKRKKAGRHVGCGGLSCGRNCAGCPGNALYGVKRNENSRSGRELS
jgi:hypothetical protein